MSTSRTESTDADRAKAAEALGTPWAVHRNGTIGGEWESDRVDRIAAALAAERAAAVADLRARVEAVAEELEQRGHGYGIAAAGDFGRGDLAAFDRDETASNLLRDAAARLRAAVTDTTGGTR